jgi:hypothetical protein
MTTLNGPGFMERTVAVCSRESNRPIRLHDRTVSRPTNTQLVFAAAPFITYLTCAESAASVL